MPVGWNVVGTFRASAARVSDLGGVGDSFRNGQVRTDRLAG
jgi:hypothetical protein